MPDGLFANPLHWVILLVIVLIIFGPGKLPSVGNALGKSIKEFKKASQEESPSPPPQNPVEPAPAMATATGSAPSTAGVSCPSCNTENPVEGRYCTNCGASLVRPVEPEAVEPAPASVACESCGTENHASNRFCAHCGKTLTHTMSRV